MYLFNSYEGRCRQNTHCTGSDKLKAFVKISPITSAAGLLTEKPEWPPAHLQMAEDLITNVGWWEVCSRVGDRIECGEVDRMGR